MWIGIAEKKETSCMTLDPHLIYKPISNYPQNNCELDLEGYRSVNDQPQTQETLVLLGDSFTWGHGVASEKTYANVLQKKLLKKGVNIKVINAGVPGYGTDQELEYLSQFILTTNKPSIVVLNMNLNDVLDNNEACLYSKEQNSLLRHSGFLNTTFLLAHVHRVVPSVIKSESTYNQLIHIIPNRKTFGCSSSKTLSDSYHYQKITLLLEEFKKLSRQHGFKFVVTIVPNQNDFDENMQDPLYQESFSKMYQAVSEAKISPFAVRDEIKLYSDTILGVSSESLSTSLFITNDPFPFGQQHLNELGNELFASSVFNYLTTNVIE